MIVKNSFFNSGAKGGTIYIATVAEVIAGTNLSHGCSTRLNVQCTTILNI